MTVFFTFFPDSMVILIEQDQSLLHHRHLVRVVPLEFILDGWSERHQTPKRRFPNVAWRLQIDRSVTVAAFDEMSSRGSHVLRGRGLLLLFKYCRTEGDDTYRWGRGWSHGIIQTFGRIGRIGKIGEIQQSIENSGRTGRAGSRPGWISDIQVQWYDHTGEWVKMTNRYRWILGSKWND